jgi:parallel beta-helix repeat protein
MQTRSTFRKVQSFAVITLLLPGSLLMRPNPHSIQRPGPGALRSGISVARELPHAVLSDSPSVRVDGRVGQPQTLADGRDLVTSYDGPADLAKALEGDQVEPLSLARGDLNGDGTPDLICGYSSAQGGMLAIHFGASDLVHSSPSPGHKASAARSTEALRAPFLSPARVFAVPSAVDYLGVGDFNADGKLDIVVATRGLSCLYLFAGAGDGSLLPPTTLALPGRVTAFEVGDVNRRDGLADIAVAVEGPAGPRLLVFEGPGGALKSKPESISLPERATSLAVGQLDDSYEMDIAVAAGHHLVIVHGRDRKLSLDDKTQKTVKPARIDSVREPFNIASLYLMDSNAAGRATIALLDGNGSVHVMDRANGGSPPSWTEGRSQPRGGDYAGILETRLTGRDTSDLVLLSRSERRVEIVSPDDSGAPTSLTLAAEPAAVLAMRLNSDGLDDLVVMMKGRAAPALITTQAAQFTVTTAIDGDPGSLRDAIESANANGAPALIDFNLLGTGPVLSVFSPLPDITVPTTVDGATQNGGFVVLEGSNAGTNASGLTFRAPNSLARGLIIINFRGLGDKPLTLHAGYGVAVLAHNCTVEGCSLGADQSHFNSGGILIGAPLVLIGGTAQGTGNLISGNTFVGVNVASGADRNEIINNFIGTDGFGKFSVPNGEGIYITDSQNNTIGGNLISGNQNTGVFLISLSRPSSGNLIQDNFVGTDTTGDLDVGNGGAGMNLLGASNNMIGGTVLTARNIISANKGGNGQVPGGLSIAGTGNLIQGNFIGTNAAGTAPLGNTIFGVFLFTDNNTLGGLAAGSGNLISATAELPTQGAANVAVTGSGNQIQGNLIGTDVSGTSALGSTSFGIVIGSTDASIAAPSNNVVSGNLVSGHLLFGIVVAGAAATGNVVEGNFVGTDIAGTKAIPNSIGVVATASAGNTVRGNLISGNSKYGVGIGSQFLGTFGDSSTLLTGNLIGTDNTGTGPLGNGTGVYVENNSIDVEITDNTIAFNVCDGIRIPDDPSPGIPKNPAIQIHISGNRIFSNGCLGIDLGPVGPTPNPFNQLTGANLLQNFPTIAGASFTKSVVANKSASGAEIPASSPSITVTGTLTAKANTAYTMEFFFGGDCTGGQGHQFLGQIPVDLGSQMVHTDAGGNAQFSFSFSLSGTPVTSSGFVNATATDPVGNTSELSLCAQVTGTVPPIPQIASASIQGKNLIVTGSNFDSHSVITMNGVDQKTLHDRSSPNTLTGKKVGKKIAHGTMVTLQVRNSDGTLSPEFTFTRN